MMMRPPSRATAAAATEQDLCLVVVSNHTRAPLHVRGEMRTPRGAVFLDEALYDLEPSGSCAFLATAANDFLVVLPEGARRLGLRGGELRLLPAAGTRQRLTPAGPGLPHRWALLVEVDVDAPCSEHLLPPLRELLRRLAAPAPLLDDAAELPPQCTVLLPPRAPTDAAADHLPPGRIVIPEALFCVQRRPTEARTLDGSRVRIVPVGAQQLLFSVEAEGGEAPPLRMQTESVPHRCAERWQLVYEAL
jgi:hypothetical protein